MRPSGEQPFVGEIAIFAGNFAPSGWAFCDGQLLAIAEYDTLFSLIGTTYGGDGESTFALPDLRGRAPLGQGNGTTLGEMAGVETVALSILQLPAHTHPLAASSLPGTTASPVGAVPADNGAGAGQYTASATGLVTQPDQNLGPVGGNQPHDNRQPYLVVNYIISLFGIYPSQSSGSGIYPFLGEIMLVPWGFAPRGYAFCAGQLLPINQNTALFSLLGTMYGGNGFTTFALPDLRNRIPLHNGNGFGQGNAGGEAAHVLSAAEMVPHIHGLKCSPGLGTTPLAGTAEPQVDNYPANSGSGSAQYGAELGTALANTTTPSVNVVSSAGGGQAHENRQPYLCLNFVIALQGIYPSQS